MISRQFDSQEAGYGIKEWADSALYEAMAAYLIVSCMPTLMDGPPSLLEGRAAFVDHVHDRMVMLAHARRELDPPKTLHEPPETAWVGVIRNYARKAPKNKADFAQLSAMYNDGNEPLTQLGKRKTEFRKEEFAAMLSNLRDEDGHPLELQDCRGAQFAEKIRLGKNFLQPPEIHGKIVMFRVQHSRLLKRFLKGDTISEIKHGGISSPGI